MIARYTPLQSSLPFLVVGTEGGLSQDLWQAGVGLDIVVYLAVDYNIEFGLGCG